MAAAHSGVHSVSEKWNVDLASGMKQGADLWTVRKNDVGNMVDERTEAVCLEEIEH